MTGTHEQAREAAIRAVLPLVPAQGWTLQAVRQAAGNDADLLFPGGPIDMVEVYIAMADSDMVAQAAAIMADQKLAQRIRTLVATRLDQALQHKRAVRSAVAMLARPANAAVALRSAYRTVDAMWRAAGDASTGVSWYTKRAILSGVYGTTLLYWLNEAHDQTDTLAFLDRRLAGVAQIGKLRRRWAARFAS